MIGEIVVDKIGTQDFYCNELVVGMSESNISKDLLLIQSDDISVGLSGSKSGREIAYETKVFIALNSNSPAIKTQRNARPLALRLSERGRMKFEHL